MSPSSPTLALQALSAAGVTMLAQTLGEDPEAQVTALEAASLAAPGPARFERLRLAWQGPQGTGERSFVLKVLPALSWSETLNPELPAPAEVLFVESDLAEVIEEPVGSGVVAASRRRGSRPAWLLYEDYTVHPSLAMLADQAYQKEALQRSARFHALHWGAQRVLDDVYPWLPRFEVAMQAHLAYLAQLQQGHDEPSPHARWQLQRAPDLPARWHTLWERLAPSQARPLASLLADPAPLLERLAHSPQSLLNGQWRRHKLYLAEGKLSHSDWSHLQVGPAAWDLATLMGDYLYEGHPSLSRSEALTLYLDEIATIIPELSPTTRLAVEQAFDLCLVLDALLRPERFEVLFTLPAPDGSEWGLTTLIETIERLL